MSDFLFGEFDGVPAKAWKQKIQAGLRGEDYNEALIWKSPETIDVRPFYHPDEQKENFSPVPGQPENWLVCQDIFVDDTGIANKLALDALSRGAEAIYFTAAAEFDLQKLFRDIDIEKKSLYFRFQFLSEDFLKKIKDFFASTESKIYIFTDIIGNLAQTGNWYDNLKKDHDTLENFMKDCPASVNPLSVDISLYQNSGATMVQQLAYALAHANEYLYFLSNKSQDTLKDRPLVFKLSVGSNYFFEIAKLRALRHLYATLAAEYGFHEHCHIFAEPSRRNKSIYDYNVNMLRSTTECMSAVLGGADTVCNQAYDALYHKSNEFGERISRNQLLVMKNESYLDTVSNPADGTYYIENLTGRLAEKALDVFKTIEAGGGFLKQLKEGIIQKKIKESAEKEQVRFDKGAKVLVGVNKYPNKEDRMKHELELYPFLKTNIRKTLIEPIVEKRLAEKTEQERLKNE